jgi:RNA polymerase sigma-70 factor (ECF subfamily)
MTRAEEFERLRALLFAIAYRILGSVAEAEDAVQETWLRYEASPTEPVSTKAFLSAVVTRISIDVLRSARVRREEYVGPWFPEPLLTDPYEDPERSAELADSLSMAALVLLERLSPLERAVFVLREVFGFEYAEVAEATGRSADAVRQLASRARKHVQARRPETPASSEAEQVTASFFAAAAGGDLQQLMDLLAPDVVLLSDGGGKAKAALRPITGADKVARFLLAIRPPAGDFDVEWRPVNGTPSAIVHLGGRLDSVATGVVADGRVVRLYLVRNPDKLSGLQVERAVTRR